MMNRRDFMKLSAASAVTMGAVAGMAPASFAENAGVHTDAEVQAMVAEELRLSREVAFYPAAFRGDFDKFYVLFHKLSRAQYEKVDGAAVPGINASHYDMCVALTNARKALRQIKDPKSTVWEIWGDQMAVESPLPTNWENCYDNEGFRPFLNPYLLRDQGKVKGNVIIIAGGGSTHRNNVVEGYPVAEFFNKNGYNAFVLRYSVSQNCPVEEVYTNAFAEAQEAMDYLHQNAGDLHIDPEQIAVVGFSAGGHLAASVGTMGRVRPAAMLLGYAVFSVPGKALGMELPDLLQQVDDQTPPAFLFATQGDHLVPATQSLQFATLLAERKIPYEMHIFAYGDHGFSTGSRHIANPQNPENPESAVWQGMALGFLNHIFNHDVLVPAPEEVKEFCLDMKIGTLLDTPQSAALIQQLLPELAQYVQQEPGSRGISVNDLQFYSNKMFDEEKLAALNEALVKLN